MKKTFVRSLRDKNEDFNILEQKIDYVFKNRDLLIQAMSHPSFCAERDFEIPSYERLEFLGDTVWQMVITNLIYQRFPDWNEGDLTKFRSFLSCSQQMFQYAIALNIPNSLLMGKGETNAHGHLKKNNLENAFEALFGAIYLDSNNLDICRNLCLKLTEPFFSQEKDILNEVNPKGSLQEYLQHHYSLLPEYRVIDATGPVHAPQYRVEVLVNNKVIASATSTSRKNAEKSAAIVALKELKNSPNLLTPEE